MKFIHSSVKLFILFFVMFYCGDPKAMCSKVEQKNAVILQIGKENITRLYTEEKNATKLSMAEEKNISKLSKAEGKNTIKLPMAEEKTKMPKAEEKDTTKGPIAEEINIGKLPKAEGKNPNKMPMAEEQNLTKQLNAEGKNTTKMPMTEEKNKTKLPNAEGQNTNKMPLAEEINTTGPQTSEENVNMPQAEQKNITERQTKQKNVIKLQIEEENAMRLQTKEKKSSTSANNVTEFTTMNSNNNLHFDFFETLHSPSITNNKTTQTGQNRDGHIIEQKLFFSKILRDNVLSAIGKLLYTNSTIITNTQLNALRQLQTLLINRQYSTTNLLPLLKIKKNSRTKQQLDELFKLLAYTLMNDEKYRYTIEVCLNALIDNQWDELLNVIDINLLKNITGETEQYASAITESIDTFETIAAKITSMLSKHEILSTSDLIAGILTSLPLENNTPTIVYAEQILYNFLSQFHESVEATSNNIPNIYDMLQHIFSELVKITDINENVRNSIHTLLPVIKNISMVHIDTEIDEKIIDMRNVIMANNQINMEQLLLHVITDGNYPNDIIKARDILISTFNEGILQSDVLFQNIDVFQSPNIEHLLLTLLNHLQESKLLPQNLSNLIQSLYIHVKMQVLTINEKQERIRSDGDVSELLFAYENLIYENNQFNELIKVIKSIRFNLLNRNISWINLIPNFDYNQYTSPRQTVHDYLELLSEVLSSNSNIFSDTVRGLINMYNQLVDEHGNPLKHPSRITPLRTTNMRRGLFGSRLFNDKWNHPLMANAASRFEQRFEQPIDIEFNSTNNNVIPSNIGSDPLEYKNLLSQPISTMIPITRNDFREELLLPKMNPTLYSARNDFKDDFNLLPTIYPPISNPSTKPLLTKFIIPFTNFNESGPVPLRSNLYKLNSDQIFDPKLSRLNIPKYNRYAIEYKPLINSLSIYSYLPSFGNENDFQRSIKVQSPEIQMIIPNLLNQNNFQSQNPENQNIVPLFSQNNFQPQYPDNQNSKKKSKFKPRSFEIQSILSNLKNQNDFQLPEIKPPRMSYLNNYNLLESQIPKYETSFLPKIQPSSKYNFLQVQSNQNTLIPRINLQFPEIPNVKTYLDRNSNQFPFHQNLPEISKSLPNDPIPPRFLGKYNNFPIIR